MTSSVPYGARLVSLLTGRCPGTDYIQHYQYDSILYCHQDTLNELEKRIIGRTLDSGVVDLSVNEKEGIRNT